MKKGIRLVDPDKLLANSYIIESENTLHELKNIDSAMWKSVMVYYFEYFLVYAILVRLGISCEIHDCTVELCKLLESYGLLPKGFKEHLRKSKDVRSKNQYYLKNIVPVYSLDHMSSLLYATKRIIKSIGDGTVDKVRKQIESI